MDEKKPDIRPVGPSLRAATRRARIEGAERSGVVEDIRGAEIARLEMLAEALQPVLAQVPEHIDLFDASIAASEQPRLFIDMIAFVEMSADKRSYRFVQDTRHGRVTLAESDHIDPMVDEITTYIARRLVERERALAGDRTIEEAARAYALEHGETMMRAPAARRETAPPERAPKEHAPKEHAPPERAPAPAPSRWRFARRRAPDAAPFQPPARMPANDEPRAARARFFRAPRGERGPRRWGQRVLDALHWVVLFLGFCVLIAAIFGALYFAWTLGEGWWVSTFLKKT